MILGSLKRQMITAFSEAKIKKTAKAHSFTFPFVAPTPGTLETELRVTVKPGHGSKAKIKRVVLGHAKLAFTTTRKNLLSLKLTGEGLRLLRESKRINLTATFSFTVAHRKPVISTETFTLT